MSGGDFTNSLFRGCGIAVLTVVSIASALLLWRGWVVTGTILALPLACVLIALLWTGLRRVLVSLSRGERFDD